MPYDITFTSSALRDVKNLEKQTREIIKKVIVLLSENPLVGDIKKLKTPFVGYRLRKGDYRIIFEIEKKEIIISSIKHRKDAYKF